MGIFDKKKKKETTPPPPTKSTTSKNPLRDGGIPLSSVPVIDKRGPDKHSRLSKTEIMLNNVIKTKEPEPVVSKKTPADQKGSFTVTQTGKSEQPVKPNQFSEKAPEAKTNPQVSNGTQNQVRKISDVAPAGYFDYDDYYYYGPGYGSAYNAPTSQGHEKGSTFGVKKYKPIENRSLVVLCVENTEESSKYRDKALTLLNKVLKNNENAFFLILKVGKDQKFSGLLDKKNIEKEKTFDSLIDSSFTEEDVKNSMVNLTSALNNINNTIESVCKPGTDFSYDEKKYRINNITVVFIGTGDSSDIVGTRAELAKLADTKNVSSIKYFCTKDVYVTKAASLGFPIIGHLETNFYK